MWNAISNNAAWLNNCVGWANHRYFFEFVAFMCLGAAYIALHALPLFLDRFELQILSVRSLLRPRSPLPLTFSLSRIPLRAQFTYSYTVLLLQSVCVPHAADAAAAAVASDVAARRAAAGAMLEWAAAGESRSQCALAPSTATAFASFAFVLCAGAAFSDGALGVWHAYLISSGQTAIELQINQRERSRCRQLGLVCIAFSTNRGFFTCILYSPLHRLIGIHIILE